MTNEEKIATCLDSVSNTIGASILTFINVYQGVSAETLKEATELVELALENTTRKDG